jgi:hypothetical protein
LHFTVEVADRILGSDRTSTRRTEQDQEIRGGSGPGDQNSTRTTTRRSETGQSQGQEIRAGPEPAGPGDRNRARASRTRRSEQDQENKYYWPRDQAITTGPEVQNQGTLVNQKNSQNKRRDQKIRTFSKTRTKKLRQND